MIDATRNQGHGEETRVLPQKKMFTTGEAAKLLNISRSTVSRKFDKGILQGKKNSLTGERLINYKSLEALIKRHDIQVSRRSFAKRSILIASSDRLLSLLVQKNFARDDRFEIHKVTLGCDVLAFFAQTAPHLLIIDDDLPDMDCSVVLESLPENGEGGPVKTICYSRGEDADKCLRCRPHEIISKFHLDEETLLERIYAVLQFQEASTKPSFEHRRRWLRVSVDLPAKIDIYPMENPTHRYSGKATLRNVSFGGGYLTGIQMDQGMLPGHPFRLLLEVDQPPLEEWEVECEVVRLHSDQSLSAGVQFLNISRPDRTKLATVLQV